MAKTYIHLHIALPTGSVSRATDFLADAQKVAADHKASQFTFDIHGGDNEQHGQSGAAVGRPQSEAARRAAEDFADDEGAGSDDTGAGGDGGEQAGSAEPPKRRGRPPGSGKRGTAQAGTAAGQRDGADGRGTASGSAAEGSGGNELVGTRQGAGQGAGQGQGGGGSARGGGNAQRGNQQAARVSTGEDRGEAGSADDWGDEDNAPDVGAEMDEEWWSKTPDADGWPDHLMPEGELTTDLLAELAAENHTASGAKDRSGTMALIKEHSGGVALPKAHPDTFDAIARALLRDTAKYNYGVKKPGK